MTASTARPARMMAAEEAMVVGAVDGVSGMRSGELAVGGVTDATGWLVCGVSVGAASGAAGALGAGACGAVGAAVGAA